jgi:hypothetical protein
MPSRYVYYALTSTIIRLFPDMIQQDPCSEVPQSLPNLSDALGTQSFIVHRSSSQEEIPGAVPH